MAHILDIPKRANALDYDPDEVQDVLDLLNETGEGKGVSVDDAQDSESKARVRARLMRKLVEAADESISVRTHVVQTGEDEYVPALSLKS
jgi:hypothetical protein